MIVPTFKTVFYFFQWALFGYLILVFWIYCIQRSLQYEPDNKVQEPLAYGLQDTEERFLTTTDGVHIQTWVHLPEKGKPMILFFHGNAYHLGQRASKFQTLIEKGYGFIAPSYRGFGKSGGSPFKEGLYSDVRAAIRLLRDLGFRTEDTIVLGESLGTGIATYMAVENQFKGVVLMSPYTSIAKRTQEVYWYLPTALILKDNFDNLRLIDRLQAPLLIVHGDHDTVIPVHHGQALFQKALEPKKMIVYPGKGHSDMDFPDIVRAMETFFK